MKTTDVTTFSYRAECPHDVNVIVEQCKEKGIQYDVVSSEKNTKGDGKWFGDMNVEFKSNATLATLQNVFRFNEDGYVALQTLRNVPLSENNLSRNFDIR